MRFSKQTWFTAASLMMVLALLALFAGCGAAATATPAPAPTEAPVATAAPAPTEVPTAAPAATEAPAATTAPAAGGFKVAEKIAAKKDGKGLVFRISYLDPSLAFADPIRQGIKDAAQEFGVDAEMVGAVGGNPDKQLAEIESLIAKGIDGLGVAATNVDVMKPVIDKAIDAGIPVVTFNSDSPGTKRLAYVGQDNVAAGREEAKQVAKVLNGKGTIAVITIDPAAEWSSEREKGLREGLQDFPDIKILNVFKTGGAQGWDDQQLYSVAENVGTANKDKMDMFVSLDCCSGPAAAKWVDRNGLKGKIKVVTFDLLPDTLNMVKSGVIQVAEGQFPYRQGYEPVKMLYELITKGTQPQNIDVGAEVVDASNIDKYLEGVQVETTPEPSASTFKLSDKIAAKKDGKGLVFRISYLDPSLAFADPIRQGIKDAAQEFGVDAEMVGAVGGNPDKQLAEIESLIAKGIDGLGVAATNVDVMKPVIDKAIDAGIPVVTFNSDSPGTKRLAYVGQDNVAAGREEAKQVAKVLNGKGTIAVITIDPAAEWSSEREKGLREGLQDFPDIKILNVFKTGGAQGWDDQQLYSVAENVGTANKDKMDMFVSLDCCSGPAAAKWVDRNGLKGKIKVVTFDLLPDTLNMVKSGVIQVAEGQFPYRQGYEPVKMLYELITKGTQPQNIDVGAEIVDASNIDKYLEGNAQ